MEKDHSGLSFKEASTIISPARLVAFSDGVFAIAVTILVFNLKVPDIATSAAHQLLPGLLRQMLPHFIAYLISFLLVAVNWTVHHRILDLINHIDINFIWINLIYLSLIAFIPFLSGLLGTYPREMISLILYIVFMAVVISVTMFMWWYASHHHRLIRKDISAPIIRYFYIRGYSTLIVFVILLILAFNHVRGVQLGLFILLPIHWFIRKSHERTAV